jgi:hypothetical protein
MEIKFTKNKPFIEIIRISSAFEKLSKKRKTEILIQMLNWSISELNKIK